MESGAGDEPPTLRPTLGSSWEAAGAALAHSLQLHRAGRGARDVGWEELLAPPAAGYLRMMNFNIMVVIGSTLLVLLFLLLCAVICLYCKVANALKPPKLPGCLALTNTPTYVSEDKVTGAASITACYPALQACDQCNLYADVDPLLPCICDVNDGTCDVTEATCDVNEGL